MHARMMWLIGVSLAVVAGGLSGGGASGAETGLPFVVTACVRTADPPEIDGRLDEACWESTRPMEPFVKLTLGTRAAVPSTAYMLYDSDRVYLGVRCQEPRVEAMKREVTEHDGPAYGDDCIEIFLIPPDSSVLAEHEPRVRYFHFVVNSRGTRYDEIGLESPGAFDGDWEAAATVGADHWDLEVSIPFSELGTEAQDGAVWTGNISRARWVEKEYSSWAPIKRTFHDVANFGRIVFTTDLTQAEERIDETEFQALRNGMLRPALKNVEQALSEAKRTIRKLPRNCKPRMTGTLGDLETDVAEVRSRVALLTPDTFRTAWQAIHRQLEDTRYAASDLHDEAVMLAATDGGRRPWHAFITQTMTNERLPANRWPRDVDILPALEITACPEEYESATFSLYAVREMQGVELDIGDLRGGDRVLSGACIEPYAVKCWYQAGRGIGDLGQRLLTPELLLKDDDLVRVDYRQKRNTVRKAPGSDEYLDVSGRDSSNLRDLTPVDAERLLALTIPARTLKQFWLTAHIPSDAAPGTYEGSVTVTARGGARLELPIEITVLPFTLAAPCLEYSIYYRGKLTKDGRGSIGSERKSPEQFAAEMRDLVAHGVTNPTIYQPYDEDLLGKVLAFRETAGMHGRSILTLGMSTGAPTSAAALEALKANVRKWLEFVRARGYDELYVYGIDEAKGERLQAERAAFQAVHEAGGKVFVACYKDYFELVGNLLDMPVWSGRPDPEEARKAHSVGHRIFNYGHPQCGVEEPETYRRNYGLLLWKAGYDGAMDYAYQHSFGHEWNDFDHQSYRDHTMAYPTANGVIGTVQWEGFREAVDDVRYLTTLLQAIEDAKDAGWWRRLRARSAARWVERIDPHDDLDAIRAEMITRILQLTR